MYQIGKSHMIVVSDSCIHVPNVEVLIFYVNKPKGLKNSLARITTNKGGRNKNKAAGKTISGNGSVAKANRP